MSDVFEKLTMEGVENIIVVASGKGGVGKSTIAANLAVTLARNGYRTALVDADIFGPSIPKMFGIEDARPEVKKEGEKEIITPIEKYGVKIISIGFFIDPEHPLIWRGPMAGKALTQMLGDTAWGEIDYMIIDFPPGTSDIQLTTVQKLNVAGALIVTTPQDIAVNDARKATAMFNNPDITVPVIGIIENMSWFTPALHPEEAYPIFGKGGGLKLAKEFDTRLLGQIPLVMEVGEAAEEGKPVHLRTNIQVTEAFENICDQLTEALPADKR